MIMCLHALVLGMLACVLLSSRSWRAPVLRCLCAWCAYVLACFACYCAYVFMCVTCLLVHMFYMLPVLNPKTAGGSVNFAPLPSPCGFLGNVFSKERVKPCFFVTFNIILRHIFPENFIEFPQVVQKIWTISLSILAIFIHFHRFFGYFKHYLVIKKLMSKSSALLGLDIFPTSVLACFVSSFVLFTLYLKS